MSIDVEKREQHTRNLNMRNGGQIRGREREELLKIKICGYLGVSVNGRSSVHSSAVRCPNLIYGTGTVVRGSQSNNFHLNFHVVIFPFGDTEALIIFSDVL